MARVPNVRLISHFFIYFSVFLCLISYSVSANRELGEENWREILEGEWMVEFYAPWCPACNALASAWRELSKQASQKGLKMRAGAVDVTKSPGLSGRFIVTALPTIFHVKDGVFRQYKGPRDVDSMLGFVEQQRWKQTDPIPGWKSPDSLQMTVVAEFFKMSQALRMVHNMLMETYGLPTWGSYLIFAVVTIFVGALLGLLLVCVIDLLYPPRRPGKVLVTEAELEKHAKGDQEREKSDDEQEEILKEDIVDEEAEDENDSDAEKNSAPSSDDEKETAEGAGDTKPGDSKDEKPTEVRKRRPRKAD